MTTGKPAETATCEWCGADYDPSARPPGRPHGTPPAKETEGAEPVTHCEWCGAEYPTPDSGR